VVACYTFGKLHEAINMSEVFENFSGPARPRAATSSRSKLKGIIWHSLNFKAMCAPLKQTEHSFGVYGEQVYHMRSCKKQSELPKSLRVAVGWPGVPSSSFLDLSNLG
jgi:hypothetical protein